MALAPNPSKNRSNRGGGDAADQDKEKRRDSCSIKAKDGVAAPADRHRASPSDREVEEDHHDHQEQECCMCGDVGFSTELFRCKRCVYRFQHTYCSRFYPSIADQDVCDWCSQDSHPSTCSSNAATSSAYRLRGAAVHKSINAGGGASGGSKRKVAGIGGGGQLIGESTSPLRREGSDDPRAKIDTGKRCSSSENAMIATRNSTTSGSSSSSKNLMIKHGCKDALELLLEVAQTVAEDETVNQNQIGGAGDSGRKNLKQCLATIATARTARDGTAVTTNGSAPSPKKQKLAAIGRDNHQTHHHNHHSHHQHQHQHQQIQHQGFKNLIKGQHGSSSSSSLRKDKFPHLSTNRSIGRRYKLLSDVMC